MCPHTLVYYYISVLILCLCPQNVETALRLLVDALVPRCPTTMRYTCVLILLPYMRPQNIETALRLLVTWILEYMDKECPNVQARIYAVIQ